jgi:hypothetical protein
MRSQKQLTIAKIQLNQQEEFTLCGDPLFGHTTSLAFQTSCPANFKSFYKLNNEL